MALSPYPAAAKIALAPADCIDNAVWQAAAGGNVSGAIE
jgi:hypothetical protein